MTLPDFAWIWIESHRRVFGLTGPSWDEAFVQWFSRRFLPLAYTEYELAEATTRCMARKPVPRSPAEHLEAIQDAVSQQRVERREAMSHLRNYTVPGGYQACSLCSDSGFTFVPHLDDVDRVEWQWLPYKARGGEIRREISVTCNCVRGMEAHSDMVGVATQKQLRIPMSLREYEVKNHKWRKMVADWRAARAIEAEDYWRNSDGDDGWAKVIRRTIERSKLVDANA